MTLPFYSKNLIYSLFFYTLLFMMANHTTTLSMTELVCFVLFGVSASALFPFTLLFIKSKFSQLAGVFNWVNWGFVICLVLSMPPIGLFFLIYYFAKVDH